MSYEGFSQKLCKRGHLSLIDCQDRQVICPVCCSPFVWTNDVDDTNGEVDGMVDLEPYLKKPVSVVNKEAEDGWITIYHHAVYNIPPPPEDPWLNEPPDEEFIKAATESATEEYGDMNIGGVINSLVIDFLAKGKYLILPEEGDIQANASHINNMYCRDFAYEMTQLVSEAEYCEELYNNIPHAFIKYQNRYFDSECLDGVDDWKNLPIFKVDDDALPPGYWDGVKAVLNAAPEIKESEQDDIEPLL